MVIPYNFFFDKLPIGRLLSGSKSLYREKFPRNVVIFNSNLITESKGKIWYGDIDAHQDRQVLLEARQEIGEDLYFLREMDARFEHENDSTETLIKKAVFVVRENRIELLAVNESKYYDPLV